MEIGSNMMPLVRYYAYYDVNKKKYFFHNPLTNTTTWVFPKDTFVINPETNQIVFSEEDLPIFDEPLSFVRRLTLKTNASDSDIHIHKRKLKQPRQRYSDFKLADVIDMKQNELMTSNIYYKLPQYDEDLKSGEADFTMLKLRKYFFKKTKLSHETLMTYEMKPYHIPLLQSTVNTKAADAAFQFIVKYGTGKKNQSSQLLTMISNNPDINDEVFIQLIKQTRNNNSSECTHRVYHLLLLVSQFFYPSSEIFLFLVRYFAAMTKNTQKQIAKFSMRYYIQIYSRYTAKKFATIPVNPENYRPLIGTSLYELMLDQYKAFPDCPLPIIIIRLLTTMKAKGALTEFVKDKNTLTIKEVVNSINSGNDSIIERSDLGKLVSILELWLQELSEPLIPKYLVPDFKIGLSTNSITHSVEKLSHVNKMTLGYIVGFIQEIKYDKKEISDDTLEYVVGSHLVRGDIPSMEIANMELGRLIIRSLIKSWDTSFVYPIPEKFLLRFPNMDSNDK